MIEGTRHGEADVGADEGGTAIDGGGGVDTNTVLHGAGDSDGARLRAWVTQAPAAIAVLSGPNFVYEVANAQYQRVFGSHRDYIGRPVREVFADVDAPEIWAALDQVYSSGAPLVGTEWAVQFETEPGVFEEKLYNFVFQPITDEHGAVGGIFVHAVDVTGNARARRSLEKEIAERARAESLLGAERSILEMIARDRPLDQTLTALAGLIEVASEGVLCSISLLDADGRHLRHGAAPSLPNAYNRAIDGIFIGPQAGSCGTSAYRNETVIVSDIAADPLWDDFRDLALMHGLRSCWSTPIRGGTGAVIGTFALYRPAPMDPPPGERELVSILTYLAGIAIERYRGEAERAKLLAGERAARSAAEDAVRARDEFLSIASHELRTPVTVIKGVSQLIERGLRRDDFDRGQIIRHIRTVARAGDRLSLLINDLLDVSRLQSGQLNLRPAPLDLPALVSEVVDRHAAGVEVDHAIELSVPGDVIVVEADAARIEQVLDNMLSNAVKYSPSGGAVRVTVSRDSDGAAVAVTDQGIGLPCGSVEQIFQPFGRAGNAVSRNLPGMGLGLFISRRIAELHGGSLSAVSPGEDRGSTFTLSLPLSGGPSRNP